MANPFPFVAGEVLTAADMNGIGESVTFTPSYVSGYTRGNGTVSAAYVRVNKLVFLYVAETLGSTSSVTGNFIFTLPIAPANAQSLIRNNLELLDVGVFRYYGAITANDATSVRSEVFTTSPGGATNIITSVSVSSIFPFVWATGDAFRFGLVYEVA